MCLFFKANRSNLMGTHTDLQDARSRQRNTSHLKEYHMDIDVSPAEDNTLNNTEAMAMISSMFLRHSSLVQTF